MTTDTQLEPTVAIQLDKTQHAADELDREIRLRRRCYPRWQADGRLTKSDATDRLIHMEYAYECLLRLIEQLEAEQGAIDGQKEWQGGRKTEAESETP